MRILLCDKKTGLFYQSKNEWTSQPEQAADFRISPRAIIYARENGLQNVEVFWDFDDPEYNVRLPIAAEPDLVVN